MSKFTKGLPPQKVGVQYVLELKYRPNAVGAWNNEEDSFHIADMQMSLYNGEWHDSCFENLFIEDNIILGWYEL